MSIEIERAPARTGDFARLAAAIDAAEATAWNRIGGATSAEVAAIMRREEMLPEPETVEDWQWLARRLARAVANGWTPRAVGPLIRLAGG